MWLKSTNTIRDKELVCLPVKKFQLMLALSNMLELAHHLLGYSLPMLQRKGLLRKNFSLSIFSLLYLVQRHFAKAKGLRAGLNFLHFKQGPQIKLSTSKNKCSELLAQSGRLSLATTARANTSIGLIQRLTNFDLVPTTASGKKSVLKSPPCGFACFKLCLRLGPNQQLFQTCFHPPNPKMDLITEFGT